MHNSCPKAIAFSVNYIRDPLSPGHGLSGGRHATYAISRKLQWHLSGIHHVLIFNAQLMYLHIQIVRGYVIGFRQWELELRTWNHVPRSNPYLHKLR